MLKNIMSIFGTIVVCIAIIVSPSIWAGTSSIPVEFKCSKNLMIAPWIVYEGIPGAQYTLTTEGLQDKGKNGIVKVTKVGFVGRTPYGLAVHFEARCISSSYNEHDVSPTGSSLTCKKGEGIKIKMFMPNDIDQDKYHYVGTLTIIQDEEKVLDDIMDDKVNLSQDKLTVPNVEPGFSFTSDF